jgi:hypothetical protein
LKNNGFSTPANPARIDPLQHDAGAGLVHVDDRHAPQRTGLVLAAAGLTTSLAPMTIATSTVPITGFTSPGSTSCS